MAITTATRRGLTLTFYGDLLLVSSLLVFVLQPSWPAVLIFGLVTSTLLGLPAVYALWRGRREFDPAYERVAKWATLAVVLAGLALFLAFSELTSVFPETMRVSDLRGPWFFLALFLVLDVAAFAGYLWLLVRPRYHHFLTASLVIAGVGVTYHLAHGWAVLEDLLRRSGDVAVNSAEVASYTHDFLLRILRPLSLIVLATRLGTLPALYDAIQQVARAEQETESKNLPLVPLPPPASKP